MVYTDGQHASLFPHLRTAAPDAEQPSFPSSAALSTYQQFRLRRQTSSIALTSFDRLQSAVLVVRPAALSFGLRDGAG